MNQLQATQNQPLPTRTPIPVYMQSNTSTNNSPAPSIPSRPQSLPETLVNAYNLTQLLPSFSSRAEALFTSGSGGDVIFTTPHDPQILTYSALFAVAAVPRGRPAIDPAKYAKSKNEGGGSSVGGILKEGEGEEGVEMLKASVCGKGKDANGEEGQVKVVQCFDEQFVHVKRIHGHMVTKPEEQLDRLLEEVIKSGKEGYAAGPATPDFVIELEAEEGYEKGSKILTEATRAPKRENLRKDKNVPSNTRRIGSSSTTAPRVAASSTKAVTSNPRSIQTTRRTSNASPVKAGRKSSTSKDKSESSSTSASEPPTSSTLIAPKDSNQPSTSPKPEEEGSVYAEVKLHRFLLMSSIPYYRYLSFGHMNFSDSSSNTSMLPYPTITYFALRVIQRWLYNPLRIGQVIEEYEPMAHVYLLSNCKRQDRNGYPPPAATAKGLVEVARAADYLGIEELADWAAKLLRKMCHRLDKCTGANCKIIIPYVLQQIDESGGLGIPQDLIDDITHFIAVNPETMWKRPLMLLSDELLATILESLKSVHSDQAKLERHRVALKKNSGNSGSGTQVSGNGPLNWWQTYLELSRVRSSIQASNTGNLQRWDEKLLGPAIEYCVHQMARNFDEPRLAAELQSKMEGGSFERCIVVELLLQITMASTVPEIGKTSMSNTPPFEKAVLNRKTVRTIFEGIVSMRTWDGYDGDWGTAEKRVMDFLKREWMTIVFGGEGPKGQSGFANWRPAMLKTVSRKLRVSMDDLLGKGEKGQNMSLSLKGKGRAAPMKDRLGNDIEPGSEDTADTTSSPLRPEAESFVPAESTSQGHAEQL